MADQEPTFPIASAEWFLHRTGASSKSSLGLAGETFALPQAGFDRNQTLRGLLNTVAERPSLDRDNPCVLYSFSNRNLPRPTSVEGWIESCAKEFPLDPVRDFWEGIWNLSVCAWNYIDSTKTEPWKSPSPGFPLTAPAFWQGYSRNRQIFDSLEKYFIRCGLSDQAVFQRWIIGQIEFLYGVPWREVPLGMAAMGLNAPSESYWIEYGQETSGPSLATPSDSRLGRIPGCRIDFKSDKDACRDGSRAVMLQFQDSFGPLWGDTVALVYGAHGRGQLFLRLRGETLPADFVEELDYRLTVSLGGGWGYFSRECHPRMEREDSSLSWVRPEYEWPWIGLARTLHCRFPRA